MSGQGAKLATGWLELTVSTEGAEKSILASVLPGAKRAGDTGGKSIGAGLLGGVRAVAAPVLGIMAGIFSIKKLGALAGMGISRALNIQDATEKLTGLGHSATDVTNIMNSALKSVKGTAFGLDEAATVAASAVASGIKPGQELTKYLSLTADAATIAGSSLSDMGQILNGVSSRGTAYTADLDQLASRGLPIFQWLQDEYGVTAAQLSKMVASGKVDAATFDKAISDHIGGAALSSGKTARGALANVGAAVSRLGAMFATPAVAAAPGLFNAVSGALDRLGVVLKPLADKFGKWLVPVLQKAVEWLNKADFGKMIDKLMGFSPVLTILSSLKPILPALATFFGDVGKALVPLAPSLADVLKSLVPLLPPLSDLLLAILPPLVETLKIIVPPLSHVVEWASKLLGPLKGGAKAWKEFQAGASPTKLILDELSGKFGTTAQAAGSFVKTTMGMFVDFFNNTVGMFSDFGSNTAGMFSDFFSNTIGMFSDFFTVNLPQGILGGLAALGQFFVQLGVNLLQNLATGLAVGVVAVNYFFTKFPSDMAGWLAGAGLWLVTTGQNILMGLVAGIQAGYNFVAAWFAAMPGNVMSFLAGAGTWLVTTGISLLQGMAAGIGTGFTAVVAFLVSLPGRVQGLLAGAGLWLVQTGINMLHGAASGASSGASSLWSFVKGLPAQIISFFAGAPSWLFTAGANLVHGLISGIRSMAGTIGSFFLSLLPGWIVGPFKAALGINSPSKVFAGYGVNIVDGLIGGMSSKQSTLDGHVSSMVSVPNVNGSSAQAVHAASALGSSSNGGMRIEGTLDLGNGLTGLIRGVVVAELDEDGRTAERGYRP